MIDITTIQTFDVPPNIEDLKTENSRLIEDNLKIAQNTKAVFVTIFISVLVGVIIEHYINKRKTSSRTKNRV